jgi:hypothetical protein
VLVCVTLAATLCAAKGSASVPTPASPAAGKWRDATLDDYRTHLKALSALVETCAKARNIESCDPMRVGPDDRILMGIGPQAERRLVRYGWLRVLLWRAEEPDKPEPQVASRPKGAMEPVPLTTSQLLQDAETRLNDELARVSGSTAVFAQRPQHTSERMVMRQVLAGSDFRNIGETSAREAAMEKLSNWLNRLFENALRLRARAPWVGIAVVGGFILLVCVGLIWGLLQLERSWRVRVAPDTGGLTPKAASARDFQLWLEDARVAAAKGHWREAVHFTYWAAIARLESRRLWPADRARTPREYLALVAPEDPRKAGLAQLTASFERVWYGGRKAGQADYQRAERLAEMLIAGGAALPDDAQAAGAREGGAR